MKSAEGYSGCAARYHCQQHMATWGYAPEPYKDQWQTSLSMAVFHALEMSTSANYGDSASDFIIARDLMAASVQSWTLIPAPAN
ncbi:hypothetical protein Hsc_1499 [Herbaspirillum seropedicae]|nr:hypothetical protein Hsc_1499 [Herbaspirillum seropedicae]